jgi:hypothetical protein
MNLPPFPNPFIPRKSRQFLGMTTLAAKPGDPPGRKTAASRGPERVRRCVAKRLALQI